MKLILPNYSLVYVTYVTIFKQYFFRWFLNTAPNVNFIFTHGIIFHAHSERKERLLMGSLRLTHPTFAKPQLFLDFTIS